MWLENYIDNRILTENTGFASEDDFFRKSTTVMTDTKKPDNCRAIFPVKSDSKGMRMIDSYETHSLIVGVSGAGKTRRVLVPAISAAILSGRIQADRPSLFINDVKGEIYEQTHELARSNGYQVVCIDLIEPEKSDGYDVLALANESRSAGDVDGMEAALAALATAISPIRPQSTMDPFWARTAQAAIMGVSLYLFETIKGKVTFPQVIAMISDIFEDEDSCRIFLKRATQRLGEDSSAVKHLRTALSGSEKTLQNVSTSTLADLSDFLKVRSLSQIMSKGHCMALNDLIKKPTIVYFKSSETNQALHGFAKLVFLQMYQRLVKLAGPGKLARPFEFFLDEVVNGAQIEQLDTMLAMCRSKGIRLHMCLQSLKQLTAVYGEKADIIRSNCGLMIVLRNTDPSTWDLVSQLSGVDMRGYTLVSSRTLAHLTTGRALVLSAGNLPYMADLCDFTELPWFKDGNN